MAITYLLLSVFTATLIGIIFKLFDRFKVPLMQAIIVNYFVCVLIGWIVIGVFPVNATALSAPWFPYSLLIGILFILGFNIAGKTFQLYGINLGTVAQKMSILVSVPFALIIFQEQLNIIKIIGIILSIGAIAFIHDIPTATRKKISNLSPIYLFLPILTLVIGGFVESMLQYVEMEIVSTSGDPQFVSFSFFTAGCLGSVLLAIRFFSGNYQLKFRGLVWGVILGIPNFFCVYFMMKSLGAGWDGSVFYPVNNVLIIVLSVAIAHAFFKEKLSLLSWIGVLLAISSIAILGISNT